MQVSSDCSGLVKCWGTHPTELQKVSILESRIPEISGRKSGHFQIVAANGGGWLRVTLVLSFSLSQAEQYEYEFNKLD